MGLLTVPFHLDERLDPSPLPFAGHTIDPELPAGTSWERMTVLYENVAATIATSDHPTVLSGDCTTSLGVLAGMQRAGLDPAIVWYDAHGDFNTDETSDSGYLGGMPVALVTGRGDKTVREQLGLRPVADEDVLLADARDLDPRERTALEDSGVRRVPVETVPLEAVPARPLYVHIDLDVLDPDELDGLHFPVRGGPALDDLADSLEGLAAAHHVAAVGIAGTWDAARIDRGEAIRVVTVVRDALGFH